MNVKLPTSLAGIALFRVLFDAQEPRVLNSLRDPLITCYNRTTLTASNIFDSVETEANNIALRTDTRSILHTTKCVCCVFDNPQTVSFRKVINARQTRSSTSV